MASFAVFTDVFLYAVVVPVLPFSITNRAGITEDKVQFWVSISLAVYGAALLISSPVWGFLAYHLQNRQIPMLLGLFVLAGATLFLCLSTSVAMLLVGRTLQGLSASLTWTVGLALVVDTVDKHHLGRAMGWIGMATSLGILVAPLLGGVVYDTGGYYAVFAMCFGLVAVDIVLRLVIVEVREARKWIVTEPEPEPEPKPRPESTLPTERSTSQRQNAQTDEEIHAGEALETQEEGRNAPQETEPQETTDGLPDVRPKRESGIKPLFQLLRKPRLLAALWGTLIHSVVQTSFDSTLPLFVSDIFSWSSLGAGLVFLPLVIPSFLSPLIGAAGDRYGPKWLATSGFILATPFLVCLRFVEEDSIAHKVMLCGLLVGVGAAIALVFGPLMAEISWSVEERGDSELASPYALAYGLYNMAFSGGAMLGPIVGGLIRDTAGWGTVAWVLGLLTAVTAVTQAIWIGETLQIRSKRYTGASSS